MATVSEKHHFAIEFNTILCNYPTGNPYPYGGYGGYRSVYSSGTGEFGRYRSYGGYGGRPYYG